MVQNWELCELSLNGYVRYREKTHFYDCDITYYGSGQYIYHVIASTEKKHERKILFRRPPFNQAIVILCDAGWELVSHQIASGGDHLTGVGFNWQVQNAFFKRPSIKDRKLDDPKLIELITE